MPGIPLPLIALGVGAYVLMGKGKGEGAWKPTIKSGPTRVLDDQCRMVTLSDEQKQQLAQYVQRRALEVAANAERLTSIANPQREEADWTLVNLGSHPTQVVREFIVENAGVVDGSTGYVAAEPDEGDVAMVIYNELTPASCAARLEQAATGNRMVRSWPTPESQCIYNSIRIPVITALAQAQGVAPDALAQQVGSVMQELLQCTGLGGIFGT
jgi:hypothetical protein